MMVCTFLHWFFNLQAPMAPLSGELSAVRLTERLSPNSEYFRRCGTLGSPSRGAGSAQPRLRGCLKLATARCLRRPLLFRLAGKEGGEKGRWVTVGCFLRLNSGKHQCFGLAFHSAVTLRVFYYAPPDANVIKFAHKTLNHL